MAQNSLSKRIQSEAFTLVFWQLVGVCILAIIAWLLENQHVAISVLAGGMAYGLPNLIFVWLVFRFVGAQQMTQFLSAFYFGEVIKLILAGILFLIIVNYLSVSLLSVLVGFIGAIVSFWIVCMWHFSKRRSGK